MKLKVRVFHFGYAIWLLLGMVAMFIAAMFMLGEATFRVDPSVSLSANQLSYIFLAVGLGMTGFVVVSVIAAIRKRKYYRHLYEDGHRVMANVIDIKDVYDGPLEREGRVPTAYFVCQARNASGEMRTFRSHTFAQRQIDELYSQTLPVYIDPDNPKKYFVDIDIVI